MHEIKVYTHSIMTLKRASYFLFHADEGKNSINCFEVFKVEFFQGQ